MKHGLMAGVAMLAVGVFLADAPPAESRDRLARDNASSRPLAREDSGPSRPDLEWIRVMPAERLVEEDLVSSDGRPVGRIDAVMLDVASGDVVYVLVSSGEDYLAVPFRSLEFHGWRDRQPIRVDQTYQQILRNSPRTAENRIAELGDPAQIARTNRAFGVPTPYGYVVPPDPDRERLPNRYLLVRPRNIDIFASRQKPEERKHARASDIRGRDVLTPTGSPVGEVAYVMLDLEGGRVAYLLLSSGEFLGLGGEWIAVPPEAISWSSDRQSGILKEDVGRGALKPLQRGELPSYVRRSQLEELYERFHTPAYQRQSRAD